MAGTRDGDKTREAIRDAAAELFFQHGYNATSLRAIAAEVGIQVGSLYNHISGKEELLADLMINVMDTLDAHLDEAIHQDPDATALSRLQAAIEAHLSYHTQHARDTFVGNSELRALGPKNRKIVLGRRRDYQHSMRRLVVAAAAEAGVDLIDATLQTFAILALGMHVASWFREDGPISRDMVIDTYTRLSLRQIGIDAAADSLTPSAR